MRACVRALGELQSSLSARHSGLCSPQLPASQSLSPSWDPHVPRERTPDCSPRAHAPLPHPPSPQAPLHVPVSEDRFLLLSRRWHVPLPAPTPNHGNFVVRWAAARGTALVRVPVCTDVRGWRGLVCAHALAWACVNVICTHAHTQDLSNPPARLFSSFLSCLSPPPLSPSLSRIQSMMDCPSNPLAPPPSRIPLPHPPFCRFSHSLPLFPSQPERGGSLDGRAG